MPVEHLDRIAEAIANDGAAIPIGVLVEVASDAAEDVVEVLVVTKIGLAPHTLEIGRKAFVEPSLRPISTRQQIAEPLMRKLVRDERIARKIELSALVVQRTVGLGRGRRVLHSAKNEIGHGDL